MERNLSLILHSYLSSILPNTSLTISVAELKELFELKDMYNRYYDFEKHILKKVINPAVRLLRKKKENGFRI